MHPGHITSSAASCAYLRLRSPGPPGALILLLPFGSASSCFRLICTCIACFIAYAATVSVVRVSSPVALVRLHSPSFLCSGAPRFGLSPSSFFPSKFSGTVPAGSLSRIGRVSPPYLMTSKRQQHETIDRGEREACSSADDDEKTRETQLNDKIDIQLEGKNYVSA